MRGGDLIVIAARPSSGKTTFMLNIVKEACMLGKRAMVFSLEVKKIEVVKRIIRSYPNIYDGAGEVSRFDLHLYDDAADIGFIKSRLMKLGRVDLIAIDYLGLISVNSRLVRSEALGEVTRALKVLAIRLDIPIILICQLNRSIEQRGSWNPKLSDLRESGDIEQDSDMVLFFQKLTETDIDSNDDDGDHTVTMIKAKHRNGKSPLTYKLRVSKEYSVFEDDIKWETKPVPQPRQDISRAENY